MNKSELIKVVAEKCDMSQNQVGAVLNGLLESVTEKVKDGEDVKLPGFGTFKLKLTAERSGFNPKTKETIIIPAGKKMAFTPSVGNKNL